ncbi:MAG: NUDIX domain-containing protein [Candidatus Scatovivens sp.]
MSEVWDIYDINKKKLGKFAQRGVYQLKDGEYHLVVTGIIINSKNQILISKRAKHKKFGGMWECNGGSILAGETSLEGVLRELKEELGIAFSKKEAIFLKEVRRDKSPQHYFKDLWLFKKDIKSEEIIFQDGEVIAFKWVTIDEFIKMYDNKEIVPTVDFGKEDYELALKINQAESYNYIGKNVNVKIDRPLNSKHPKHGFIYLVNYGYVPNTISGDGEELDCYILGVQEPLESFEGRCIAVIHRTNDNDDKLIIAPDEKNYTDEEIRKATNFQEQYFESEIIR